MNEKTVTVEYSACGSLGYSGIQETIKASVEISPDQNYSATVEFLRSRVLDNLDEEIVKRHKKIHSEYEEACQKFYEVTKKLQSAYEQWTLVSNFLETQGLKTDNAEFPKEALTNLTKSLPPFPGDYPE